MFTPFLCLPKRIPLGRGCVLYTTPQGSIHQFTMVVGKTKKRHLEEHDMPRFYNQYISTIDASSICMDSHGFCEDYLCRKTPPTRYHGFQRLQASKKDRAVADGRTVPISFPLTNCPGKKHRFSGDPHIHSLICLDECSLFQTPDV